VCLHISVYVIELEPNLLGDNETAHISAFGLRTSLVRIGIKA